MPTTAAATTTSVVDTTSSPATTAAVVDSPSTLVPIDPTVLIPVDATNKALPAPGDDLADEYHGYLGDPNATLMEWMVTPMAVPSGPDVRLLGFERNVGINSTTATFLTGAIDPDTALASIAAVLAPSTTYTTTPSTRTEGTVIIHVLDAQPTTVQGDPPGWSLEASAIDRLGVIRIKRSDYAFTDVVPTFDDLPKQLQEQVVNQDAIAVNAGGTLSSIAYEYGVSGLSQQPVHRTRLTYAFKVDFPTATANLERLLSVGWDENQQTEAVYFTSTTSAEVWTLDDFGGTTHLTYDTGG